MANEQNLKPFVKGDPRINRKGRPRSFQALRELARQIADEKAKSGSQTLVIDGHSATVVEAILRSWAISKDPRKQKAFMEIAYGKVPDKLDVESKNELTVKFVNDWRDNTPESSQGTEDSTPTGEKV